MLVLIFNFKALGVNHYQKNSARGRYITAQGKQYQKDMKQVLTKSIIAINKFLEGYDDTKEGFEVDIVIKQSNFFTKKGVMSKVAGDVDGPVKIIIDQVFRFFDIDDSRVIKVSCEKVSSNSDSFVVIIKRRPVA